MDLKTIDQLEIGYSKYQLYRRIERLENQGLIDPQRGGRNQILLSPHNISVLQRLAELEEGSKNVQSAILQLENEQLERENERLQDKNEQLQNELVARNNLIQRLTSPSWIQSLQEALRSALSHFK